MEAKASQELQKVIKNQSFVFLFIIGNFLSSIQI